MSQSAEDTTERVRQTVWAIAGTLLLGIGAFTSSTLHDLSESVEALEKAILTIRHDVDGLPPDSLMLELRWLRESASEVKLEQQRLQTQIDQNTAWIRELHPASKRPPRRPYVGD